MLIYGRLNSADICGFWRIDPTWEIQPGDYAIVENKSDFDLVKVLGIVNTIEKYTKHFIPKGDVTKKVVYTIPRKEIRED